MSNKLCKNCGSYGGNVGCDVCGPPVREIIAQERLARTAGSASSTAIIRRKEYPQNYFGHNDHGPIWNSSIAYAKRVPLEYVQAIINEMASNGQHAWGEIHPQND